MADDIRWRCVTCEQTYTDDEVDIVQDDRDDQRHPGQMGHRTVQQELCPTCEGVCDPVF